MTRRNLFQAAMVGAWASAARSAASPLPSFDGMIARAGLIDDVVRLAAWDARIPADAASALTRFEETARLGIGIPAGERPSEPAALAVWLGARISRIGEAWGVAEDAAVLAARGPRATASKADVARFLDAIDYRCRIAFHTLDPEESDIHRWLEGIAVWSRGITAYKANLAAAIAAGGSSFADPADPLVQLAHAARRGRAGIAQGLAKATPTCPYGQAIASALTGLRG